MLLLGWPRLEKSVTPMMARVLDFMRLLLQVGDEASVTSGWRLPLNHLTRMLLQWLGIAISQLAPNSRHTFMGAQVLWGIMSEGQETLSLNEFLYCHKLV